jgi:ketosteroid isomerase-like protein
MKSTPIVFCLSLAGSLCGCTGGDQTLPDDVTSALETAFNRGDVAACAALYSDDAEIISEDAPVVRGKKGIEEFFSGQMDRKISFDTDSTLSIVSGDLAVEQGTYRVRDVERGADVEYGEFLNIWRKRHGQWRNFRSMYNTTEAPKGAVSVSPEDTD